MREFLIQTGTQLPIIALIWLLISRDASKIGERKSSNIAAISPFDWGALCGLTFIALIPYFILRFKASRDAKPHAQFRNLSLLWIALSVAASIWAVIQLRHHDNNDAAQHFLLATIFLICAIIDWFRNHRSKSS